MVLQNVEKAQIKLTAKKDNVAGVTLPVFHTSEEGSDSKQTMVVIIMDVLLLLLLHCSVFPYWSIQRWTTSS